MEENILKTKIHQFIIIIYKETRDFPKHEIYGLTTQLRRAGVSVMLNFLEGYARRKEKVKLNFWEISYGSIKECKYILYLSKELEYLSAESYDKLYSLSEEISAMLWISILKLEKSIKNK